MKDLDRHFTKEDTQMASKYLKNMLSIIGHQRNAKQTYSEISFTPTRMAKMEKTDIAKIWRECGATGTLSTMSGNIK